MNAVFFDTKHVRRSQMLRKNKNHDSVMPLNPTFFLLMINPVFFSDNPTGKTKDRQMKTIIFEFLIFNKDVLSLPS